MLFTISRYQELDLTAPVRFTEFTFLVPNPKPRDSFYQFFNPFEVIVWYYLLALFTIFVITFMVGICFTKNLQKKQKTFTSFHVDVYFIDYFIYTAGIFLTPMTGKKLINHVRLGTIYGLFGLITMVLGAFFIMNIYKNELLSHLTVIEFEKPLRTVDGKIL